ncbi:MAG: tyrosine-type recombinase/integrase [Paludibacteraceae bacterium]|nr:tyrosine-type recombinase/integrase [Paludibacteraceae bacterium]
MLIDRFLQYIKYEKGYSSHTFVSYQADLSQFEKFVLERSGAEEFVPDKVDSSLVREWIVSMMEAGVSASTVNRKLSALKSFFSYLCRMGEVRKNPMSQVVSPKRQKRLPKFLREEEMSEMFSGRADMFGEGYEAVRDELIMETFYTLGIRLSELIALKDTDVDLRSRTVLVNGKRNKQRYVPFGESLKNSMLAYLSVRDEAVPERSGYFFVRPGGEPLYPMLVYRIVHRCITAVSTLSKRSPHVLRHTFATAMLNNGADLEAVKELLGHANLAATEVYTHTTFEQLQKNYKQAHPRALN